MVNEISKSQRGFSIVEATIAVSIAASFAVGMSVYYKYSDNIIKKESVSSSALNIKMNLQQVLNDDTAWNNTANRSVFRCVETNNCAPDLKFAVYDGRNQLYYDSTRSNSGFNLSGLACNTFPSENCPVRANIDFNIINCPSGTCFPRQIEVEVGFVQSDFLKVESSAFETFTLIKNISGCPPGQFFHEASGRCVRYPVLSWDFDTWRAETVKDANMWVIAGNRIIHYIKVHSDPDDIIKGFHCKYVVYDVTANQKDPAIPKGNVTTCGSGYGPTNRTIKYVWTGDTASNYFLNRYGRHDISATAIDADGKAVQTYSMDEDGVVDTSWTRATMVYPVKLNP